MPVCNIQLWGENKRKTNLDMDIAISGESSNLYSIVKLGKPSKPLSISGLMERVAHVDGVL
jgi:hypothetical protein